jgi:hypothetical protein
MLTSEEYFMLRFFLILLTCLAEIPGLENEKGQRAEEEEEES